MEHALNREPPKAAPYHKTPCRYTLPVPQWGHSISQVNDIIDFQNSLSFILFSMKSLDSLRDFLVGIPLVIVPLAVLHRKIDPWTTRQISWRQS